jgi:hypothetical protein
MTEVNQQRLVARGLESRAFGRGFVHARESIPHAPLPLDAISSRSGVRASALTIPPKNSRALAPEDAAEIDSLFFVMGVRASALTIPPKNSRALAPEDTAEIASLFAGHYTKPAPGWDPR